MNGKLKEFVFKANKIWQYKSYKEWYKTMVKDEDKKERYVKESNLEIKDLESALKLLIDEKPGKEKDILFSYFNCVLNFKKCLLKEILK